MSKFAQLNSLLHQISETSQTCTIDILNEFLAKDFSIKQFVDFFLILQDYLKIFPIDIKFYQNLAEIKFRKSNDFWKVLIPYFRVLNLADDQFFYKKYRIILKNRLNYNDRKRFLLLAQNQSLIFENESCSVQEIKNASKTVCEKFLNFMVDLNIKNTEAKFSKKLLIAQLTYLYEKLNLYYTKLNAFLSRIKCESISKTKILLLFERCQKISLRFESIMFYIWKEVFKSDEKYFGTTIEFLVLLNVILEIFYGKIIHVTLLKAKQKDVANKIGDNQKEGEEFAKIQTPIGFSNNDNCFSSQEGTFIMDKGISFLYDSIYFTEKSFLCVEIHKTEFDEIQLINTEKVFVGIHKIISDIDKIRLKNLFRSQKTIQKNFSEKTQSYRKNPNMTKYLQRSELFILNSKQIMYDKNIKNPNQKLKDSNLKNPNSISKNLMQFLFSSESDNNLQEELKKIRDTIYSRFYLSIQTSNASSSVLMEIFLVFKQFLSKHRIYIKRLINSDSQMFIFFKYIINSFYDSFNRSETFNLVGISECRPVLMNARNVDLYFENEYFPLVLNIEKEVAFLKKCKKDQIAKNQSPNANDLCAPNINSCISQENSLHSTPTFFKKQKVSYQSHFDKFCGVPGNLSFEDISHKKYEEKMLKNYFRKPKDHKKTFHGFATNQKMRLDNKVNEIFTDESNTRYEKCLQSSQQNTDFYRSLVFAFYFFDCNPLFPNKTDKLILKSIPNFLKILYENIIQNRQIVCKGLNEHQNHDKLTTHQSTLSLLSSFRNTDLGQNSINTKVNEFQHKRDIYTKKMPNPDQNSENTKLSGLEKVKKENFYRIHNSNQTSEDIKLSEFQHEKEKYSHRIHNLNQTSENSKVNKLQHEKEEYFNKTYQYMHGSDQFFRGNIPSLNTCSFCENKNILDASKKLKTDIEMAVIAFNKHKTIKEFNELLISPYLILRYHPNTDFTVLGNFLAKESNEIHLSNFLETFNFQKSSILVSLRDFLSTFLIPGEYQCIMRVLLALSHKIYNDKLEFCKINCKYRSEGDTILDNGIQDKDKNAIDKISDSKATTFKTNLTIKEKQGNKEKLTKTEVSENLSKNEASEKKLTQNEVSENLSKNKASEKKLTQNEVSENLSKNEASERKLTQNEVSENLSKNEASEKKLTQNEVSENLVFKNGVDGYEDKEIFLPDIENQQGFNIETKYNKILMDSNKVNFANKYSNNQLENFTDESKDIILKSLKGDSESDKFSNIISKFHEGDESGNNKSSKIGSYQENAVNETKDVINTLKDNFIENLNSQNLKDDVLMGSSIERNVSEQKISKDSSMNSFEQNPENNSKDKCNMHQKSDSENNSKDKCNMDQKSDSECFKPGYFSENSCLLKNSDRGHLNTRIVTNTDKIFTSNEILAENKSEELKNEIYETNYIVSETDTSSDDSSCSSNSEMSGICMCERYPDKYTQHDVYVILYSVIILNTNLHNINITYKTTEAQFLENLRKCKLTTAFSDNYVSFLYNNIKNKKIEPIVANRFSPMNYKAFILINKRSGKKTKHSNQITYEENSISDLNSVKETRLLNNFHSSSNKAPYYSCFDGTINPNISFDKRFLIDSNFCFSGYPEDQKEKEIIDLPQVIHFYHNISKSKIFSHVQNSICLKCHQNAYYSIFLNLITQILDFVSQNKEFYEIFFEIVRYYNDLELYILVIEKLTFTNHVEDYLLLFVEICTLVDDNSCKDHFLSKSKPLFVQSEYNTANKVIDRSHPTKFYIENIQSNKSPLPVTENLKLRQMYQIQENTIPVNVFNDNSNKISKESFTSKFGPETDYTCTKHDFNIESCLKNVNKDSFGKNTSSLRSDYVITADISIIECKNAFCKFSPDFKDKISNVFELLFHLLINFKRENKNKKDKSKKEDEVIHFFIQKTKYLSLKLLNCLIKTGFSIYNPENNDLLVILQDVILENIERIKDLLFYRDYNVENILKDIKTTHENSEWVLPIEKNNSENLQPPKYTVYEKPSNYSFDNSRSVNYSELNLEKTSDNYEFEQQGDYSISKSIVNGNTSDLENQSNIQKTNLNESKNNSLQNSDDLENQSNIQKTNLNESKNNSLQNHDDLENQSNIQKTNLNESKNNSLQNSDDLENQLNIQKTNLNESKNNSFQSINDLSGTDCFDENENQSKCTKDFQSLASSATYTNKEYLSKRNYSRFDFFPNKYSSRDGIESFDLFYEDISTSQDFFVLKFESTLLSILKSSDRKFVKKILLHLSEKNLWMEFDLILTNLIVKEDIKKETNTFGVLELKIDEMTYSLDLSRIQNSGLLSFIHELLFYKNNFKSEKCFYPENDNISYSKQFYAHKIIKKNILSKNDIAGSNNMLKFENKGSISSKHHHCYPFYSVNLLLFQKFSRSKYKKIINLEKIYDYKIENIFNQIIEKGHQFLKERVGYIFLVFMDSIHRFRDSFFVNKVYDSFNDIFGGVWGILQKNAYCVLENFLLEKLYSRNQSHLFHKITDRKNSLQDFEIQNENSDIQTKNIKILNTDLESGENNPFFHDKIWKNYQNKNFSEFSKNFAFNFIYNDFLSEINQNHYSDFRILLNYLKKNQNTLRNNILNCENLLFTHEKLEKMRQEWLFSEFIHKPKELIDFFLSTTSMANCRFLENAVLKLKIEKYKEKCPLVYIEEITTKVGVMVLLDYIFKSNSLHKYVSYCVNLVSNSIPVMINFFINILSILDFMSENKFRNDVFDIYLQTIVNSIELVCSKNISWDSQVTNSDQIMVLSDNHVKTDVQNSNDFYNDKNSLKDSNPILSDEKTHIETLNSLNEKQKTSNIDIQDPNLNGISGFSAVDAKTSGLESNIDLSQPIHSHIANIGNFLINDQTDTTEQNLSDINAQNHDNRTEEIQAAEPNLENQKNKIKEPQADVVTISQSSTNKFTRKTTSYLNSFVTGLFFNSKSTKKDECSNERKLEKSIAFDSIGKIIRNRINKHISGSDVCICKENHRIELLDFLKIMDKYFGLEDLVDAFIKISKVKESVSDDIKDLNQIDTEIKTKLNILTDKNDLHTDKNSFINHQSDENFSTIVNKNRLKEEYIDNDFFINHKNNETFLTIVDEKRFKEEYADKDFFINHKNDKTFSTIIDKNSLKEESSTSLDKKFLHTKNGVLNNQEKIDVLNVDDNSLSSKHTGNSIFQNILEKSELEDSIISFSDHNIMIYPEEQFLSNDSVKYLENSNKYNYNSKTILSPNDTKEKKLCSQDLLKNISKAPQTEYEDIILPNTSQIKHSNKIYNKDFAQSNFEKPDFRSDISETFIFSEDFSQGAHKVHQKGYFVDKKTVLDVHLTDIDERKDLNDQHNNSEQNKVSYQENSSSNKLINDIKKPFIHCCENSSFINNTNSDGLDQELILGKNKLDFQQGLDQEGLFISRGITPEFKKYENNTTNYQNDINIICNPLDDIQYDNKNFKSTNMNTNSDSVICSMALPSRFLKDKEIQKSDKNITLSKLTNIENTFTTQKPHLNQGSDDFFEKCSSGENSDVYEL